MADLIVVGILLVIVGAAVAYIVKAKKSGVKCIGCPSDGACSHKSGASACSCGCGGGMASTDSSEGSCCCSKSE